MLRRLMMRFHGETYEVQQDLELKPEEPPTIPDGDDKLADEFPNMNVEHKDA